MKLEMDPGPCQYRELTRDCARALYVDFRLRCGGARTSHGLLGVFNCAVEMAREQGNDFVCTDADVAREIGMSTGTIKRCKKRLREMDVIYVTRGPHNSTWHICTEGLNQIIRDYLIGSGYFKNGFRLAEGNKDGDWRRERSLI